MKYIECSLGHECGHQASHCLAVVVGHQLTLGRVRVVILTVLSKIAPPSLLAHLASLAQ